MNPMLAALYRLLRSCGASHNSDPVPPKRKKVPRGRRVQDSRRGRLRRSEPKALSLRRCFEFAFTGSQDLQDARLRGGVGRTRTNNQTVKECVALLALITPALAISLRNRLIALRPRIIAV